MCSGWCDIWVTYLSPLPRSITYSVHYRKYGWLCVRKLSWFPVALHRMHCHCMWYTSQPCMCYMQYRVSLMSPPSLLPKKCSAKIRSLSAHPSLPHSTVTRPAKHRPLIQTPTVTHCHNFSTELSPASRYCKLTPQLQERKATESPVRTLGNLLVEEQWQASFRHCEQKWC